jgi:SAM-dependent methyltransferase
VNAGPWGAGEAYERFIGRWSRRLAAAVVDGLDVPAGSDWADVGCGTGALTATILERAKPRTVTGVEPFASFLAHARATIDDPRAVFVEGSAAPLPLPNASVDVAVAGLVLNFVPDAQAALGEMRRICRDGGIVAGHVWDYAAGMELIRRFFDAAIAEDDGAREADERPRFPICHPGPLGDAFERAGLREVTVEAVDVPTVFTDFDDFWRPFLAGVGVAPHYLVGLEPATQVRIRERLRASLPTEPDGSIRLVARAWAARGRV